MHYRAGPRAHERVDLCCDRVPRFGRARANVAALCRLFAAEKTVSSSTVILGGARQQQIQSL